MMQCRCTRRRRVSLSRIRVSFPVLQGGARALGRARGTNTTDKVERRLGMTQQNGSSGMMTLQTKNQTSAITAKEAKNSGTKVLEVQENRATSLVLQEGLKA